MRDITYDRLEAAWYTLCDVAEEGMIGHGATKTLDEARHVLRWRMEQLKKNTPDAANAGGVPARQTAGDEPVNR